MSKDGRIGNRALLKALADYLGMEGVNRAPDMLNRDQVQVVVSLGNVGGYEVFEHLTVGAAIGGQPSYFEQIFPASSRPELRGKTLQVLSVNVSITGVADVADTAMDLRLSYSTPSITGIIDIPRWETTRSAAGWTRTWALGQSSITSFNARSGGGGSGWNGIIPGAATNYQVPASGEMGIRLDVARESGNWVAPASITTRAICVAIPTGQQLPW